MASSTFDVQAARAQFPALSQKQVYFDNVSRTKITTSPQEKTRYSPTPIPSTFLRSLGRRQSSPAIRHRLDLQLPLLQQCPTRRLLQNRPRIHPSLRSWIRSRSEIHQRGPLRSRPRPLHHPTLPQPQLSPVRLPRPRRRDRNQQARPRSQHRLLDPTRRMARQQNRLVGRRKRLVQNQP